MKERYIGRICKPLLLQLVFALLSEFAFAQAPISGRVTGETVDCLPGINVIVKGTTQGPVTDVIRRAYEGDKRYVVRNSYIENGGNMLFGLDKMTEHYYS